MLGPKLSTFRRRFEVGGARRGEQRVSQSLPVKKFQFDEFRSLLAQNGAFISRKYYQIVRKKGGPSGCHFDSLEIGGSANQLRAKEICQK
jgi:hypothetical protein